MEITAHRGASAYAPENSFAAVKTAIELEVDCIELDLQETADGKIILLHDPTFLRTGNINRNVWDVTYNEAKTFDIGSWFSEEFSKEYPPLLTDILDLIGGKCKINLELKYNGRNKHLPVKVADFISDLNLEDQCIVTSFNLSFVNRIKENSPKITTGFISSLPYRPSVWLTRHPILSLNKISSRKVIVSSLQKLGKKVHIWTPDKEKDIISAIDSGADNIISNRPDVVKQIAASRIKE
ncbi:MAG: hypothetical protein SCALA702_10830 [Melioribacteraceae bacterium]|nr:MAG: hypothetical protein SCALA702_10830 [Melioribacteraceae bacterium]